MIAQKQSDFTHLDAKPCRIIPACRRGNHHSHPSDVLDKLEAAEAHFINPIGKYYRDEDELIHDLGSFKRGEVYSQADFYQRLRAWYKAEVSRLDHWLSAKRMWVWDFEKRPNGYTCWASRWQEEIEAEEIERSKVCQMKIPTRRQPARTAKSRAAESAALAKRPAKAVGPGRAKGETVGAYMLDEEHWFDHLNTYAKDSQSPSSAVCETETGLALFEEQVRRAVDTKLLHLLQLKKPCRCALPKYYEAPPFIPKALSSTVEHRTEEDSKETLPDPMTAEIAVMELSPTLGRWPEIAMECLPVEDLDNNVVKLGGLRFAVDVCAVYTTAAARHHENVLYVMV